MTRTDYFIEVCPDEEEVDWEEIMQDHSASGNHGRRTTQIKSDLRMEGYSTLRPARNLNSESNEVESALYEVGRISIAPGDEMYYGLTAHRGILTEEEADWLDWDLIRYKVWEMLGTSKEEIEVLYGPGRPDSDRAARRAEIDGKLLEFQAQGANMHQMAIFLGWPIRTTPTGSECQKMSKALARARSANG